jgi:hypothetical protein
MPTVLLLGLPRGFALAALERALVRSATRSVSVLSQVFRGLAEMPPAIR